MKNNFIKSFLNELLKERKVKSNKISTLTEEIKFKNNVKINNKETNFHNGAKTSKAKKEEKNIKIDLKEKTDNIKAIKNDIGKEMFGYLNTNSNLDNSLLKMDIEKDLNSGVDLKNKSIKDINNKNIDIKIIKKNNKKISLGWILFEFVVGILLIIYTLSYVKGNEAESKFLFSSVQLWKNIGINLVGKIGFLSKDVESDYIKKRETEVKEMMKLEDKIQNCIHNEKDNNKKKALKDVLYKISSFKYELMDTKSIPLDDFIKNYDKFSLYGYGLKQTTDKLCK